MMEANTNVFANWLHAKSIDTIDVDNKRSRSRDLQKVTANYRGMKGSATIAKWVPMCVSSTGVWKGGLTLQT